MTKRAQRLTLVVELSEDEATDFCRLAGTNDPQLQQGIAKSLVLGASKVVVPADVADDIKMVLQFYEFATSSNMEASQDMADAVLYTRAQLNEPAMKRAAASWANCYWALIKGLEQDIDTPTAEQFRWVMIADDTQMILDSLHLVLDRARGVKR